MTDEVLRCPTCHRDATEDELAFGHIFDALLPPPSFWQSADGHVRLYASHIAGVPMFGGQPMEAVA